MPKFHVVCEKHVYTTRVVLEVNAVSANHARRKVEDSQNPLGDFTEVWPFREPDCELSVTGVRDA